MKEPINDKLLQIKQHGNLPFHMPGHKRKMVMKRSDAQVQLEFNQNQSGAGQARPESDIDLVKQMDITEISGCDNLHDPREIIRESMDQLKQIYGSKESWYLVNGSTVGILAAISAVCRPGDRIVIARNCHKAVYHAARLLRLKSSYIYPEKSRDYDFFLDVGASARQELREVLTSGNDVKAVVLTSPTYEGIVSDVAAVRKMISDIDDRIVLIVDEAHGAHMHFHEAFPDSAVSCGADIVIHSTHKTLPALTQTALLHLCSDRVSRDRISDWLAVYETSSPSYILMASAEASVIFMHKRGKKVQKYVDNLRKFRMNCGQLLHIHLVEGEELPVFAYDTGKLVFSVQDINNGGSWLFEKLRDDWNIELEMESVSYVIAMTSVMDEEKDFDRLWQALGALDRELDTILKENNGESGQRPATRTSSGSLGSPYPFPEKVMEAWEAMDKGSLYIPLSESIGKTAASYVMLYPPGIPLLVPGEKIIKEMVENLKFYLYNGYNVQGLENEMIPVIDEPIP